MSLDNRIEDVTSNYDEGGWLDSFDRGPDDSQTDKGEKKDDPDFSIHTPDETSEKKEKTEVPNPADPNADQQRGGRERQQEQTNLYNQLVVKLGNRYSPEILNKAKAKYFEGAAPENTAEIQDPVRKKVAEEQNRQVEQVCKVLDEVSGDGSHNDVMENVFVEYVNDVELAGKIAEAERRLPPSNSGAQSEQERFARMREEAMTEYQQQLESGSLAKAKSGNVTDAARRFNLAMPVLEAGGLTGSQMTGSEMPREAMQIYYEKLQSEQQRNVDNAKLASLDHQLNENAEA